MTKGLAQPAGESPAPPRVGTTDVLRFAWPSVLSFVCNSAFRVNDQFWIGGLGAEAHAAMGAATFVLILNFAVYFVTVAGTLPQVARTTGAGDPAERDAVVRHAFTLGACVALVLGVLGWTLAPSIAGWLGVEGRTAELAVDYLRVGYLFCLPLALTPLVENVFIGMGDTRTPLVLQVLAVSLNFVLNPLLIYGAAPLPGARAVEPLFGMGGAAAATGLSRLAALGVGLYMLTRRGIQWRPPRRMVRARLTRIGSVGFPAGASIAVYASVYFLLLRFVFRPLDDSVLAGFGIGFNAFEGIAFPFYLGVAIAGASLVGRALGAGSQALADEAIRNVRRVGLALGLLAGVLFYFAGPLVAPAFTDDPTVLAEVRLYVMVLAFSQPFVALETTSEKTLLGAGVTRPILWISVPGNLLRAPLAFFFALTLGWGALGIWWAINLTTVLKALAFHLLVTRGAWRHSPARQVG